MHLIGDNSFRFIEYPCMFVGALKGHSNLNQSLGITVPEISIWSMMQSMVEGHNWPQGMIRNCLRFHWVVRHAQGWIKGLLQISFCDIGERDQISTNTSRYTTCCAANLYSFVYKFIWAPIVPLLRKMCDRTFPLKENVSRHVLFNLKYLWA